MIQLQDAIDVLKLNNGGCITTDTCNAAQKTCHILVKFINDIGGIVYKQDCYHHLWCVHINCMAKSVVGYMGKILEWSLKNKLSAYLLFSISLKKTLIVISFSHF